MKNSDSALTYNKLGVRCFAEGDFIEAIKAYQAAIDLRPDFTDAYYNLGLALNKAKRADEARHAYEAVIALQSDHLGGRFHLGCFCMQREDFSQALKHFSVIEDHYPDHVESLINAGACYLRLGYLNEAKSRYQRALLHAPTELQALFNLGVISAQQGRAKEAASYYLQAVKIDPAFHDAHNNLAVVYLGLGDAATALLHFQAALRIQPDNQAVLHSIDILTRGKNMAASPAAYIRSLFDSYADHYDAHLQQALHYQVPQRLYEAVSPHGKPDAWDILDLGCGTGLCGQVFKPFARRMVGVDLSGKMLALAEKKHLYDALIEADILDYLQGESSLWDLIIAGDTLVYFGDLAPLFQAVSRALKLGGFFAFNVEISAGEDYVMTDSGRFAHSEGYLAQLAQAHHLVLCSQQISVLRTHHDRPVSGHIYLMQRLI